MNNKFAIIIRNCKNRSTELNREKLLMQVVQLLNYRTEEMH